MPSDPAIDRRVHAFIQTEYSGRVAGYNYVEGVTLAPVAKYWEDVPQWHHTRNRPAFRVWQNGV
jgi:hypothetical protein